MDEFYVDFHHGGFFAGDKYEQGEVSNWKCDADKWSYFEILGVVNEMGYPGVLEIWYDFAGTLKALEDDYGAIEALNWSKTNGKVDIYIVHPISQPDIVAQPETTEVPPETEVPAETEVPPETTEVPLETTEAQPETNEAQSESKEAQPETNEAHSETEVGEVTDRDIIEGFYDSADEILNDGFGELLVGEGFIAGQNDQPLDELLPEETSKKRKRTNGRPKKKKVVVELQKRQVQEA
ncbi:uncharacterized protein LOC131623283 [Vicia villosa]|uniref:uncharacterized protein LOC131623283 n=1 Tax=Vicia villosa TaxID=3911 RepID=UPI00273C4F44|nr:uncharacterized protein LOC131623283 [Vicia villosa]